MNYLLYFEFKLTVLLLWTSLPEINLLLNYQQPNRNGFAVFWNIPIHKCARLNISMNLSKYNIIYNENEQFIGENVTIFYKIGKFPFINDKGIYINGGIPQLGNITAHIKQVQHDIVEKIPNPGYQGLAVIDWENWRPEWHTNWYPYDIYRDKSIRLIKDNYPWLINSETLSRAVYEFEFYARLYMQITIMIGHILRPRGLWGFYGFPDCFNYQSFQKYCSVKTTQRNDKIGWLYKSSSALYPSIYLREWEKNESENAVYVYGRLHEAKRIAKNLRIPIYPYSNVHYHTTGNFLNQTDLLITVGQAAALGFPGVVLWGSYNQFNSREKCKYFESYVHSTLGPTLTHIQSIVRKKPQRLEFPDTLHESMWLDTLMDYFYTVEYN